MTIRRHALLFVLLALFGLAGARAEVVLVFADPARTGNPGQTLQFRGTIDNDGPGEVYLNSFSINLISPDPSPFTFTDLFPFPVLGAGDNTGLIQLFEYAISDPFSASPGTYSGQYTLLGGGDMDAADVLAISTFSIKVELPGASVPEPGTFGLAALCMLALAVSRRRPGQPKTSINAAAPASRGGAEMAGDQA